MRFGYHTVKILPKLMSRGEGAPKITGFPENMSGPDIFMSISWQDWPEANLREVAVYLRGGRSLALSPNWRRVFPTTW